jgi:diadenosine tetraphosphate (Ap4A) HIT family hydrolase
MKDCLFCKIIAGEIPSFKIWEDKNFLAFLDINPNTKGQSLIVSKKHYPSYIFGLPENDFKKMLLATRKVAKLLDKVLNVRRSAMIFEGMGVNHAHLKVYPLHGLKKEFGAGESTKRIYFKKYAGFVTSQLGPQANFEELKKLAERIRKNA